MLRAHCDRLGTDYAAIEKTLQGSTTNPVDDPDALLRDAEAYAELGVEHIHFRAQGPDMAGFVRRFGDVVAPRLSAIGSDAS